MPEPTKKSWTFMVYMAGDNSLDPNGIQDLKEMKRVGTNADINVVAQFDSESAGHRTTRYLLTKGSDLAGDFVDNLEMKQVVKAVHKKLGRKLDLLGMDACLMSMPEVGYQMRSHVAFTVGSEETEPLDGWPYQEILGKLAKTPDMTPDGLGKVVVKEY